MSNLVRLFSEKQYIDVDHCLVRIIQVFFSQLIIHRVTLFVEYERKNWPYKSADNERTVQQFKNNLFTIDHQSVCLFK